VLRALHAAEVYVGVVGLTALNEPAVPIIAPLATRPQCLRQSCAPGLVIASTIVLVAIKVPTGVAWELARASVCKDALPGTWDLQVEAVLAIHIIADVCDLDDHAFAHKIRMRSAPTVGVVDRVHKLELIALPTIGIPFEPVHAADGNCRETHAQTLSDEERLVVRARGRLACTIADRRLVRIFQLLSGICIASQDRPVRVALARP